MKVSPEQARDFRNAYGSILDGVEDYLAYRKEVGDTMLPVTDPSFSIAQPQIMARTTEAPQASARREKQPAETQLAKIAQRVASCELCPLCKKRTNTVPGQGNPSPELMFIGEGPGAKEDEQGLPFVGQSGNLLTKMIEAMGLDRDEVFITNIVKCRPPENRNPASEEMDACMPYLHEQIAILQPKVIVALGAVAVKGLLNVSTGISKLRGNWHSFQGIDMMPTYHPAYLLRNPPMRKDVWNDLKEVLRRIGKPVPGE